MTPLMFKDAFWSSDFTCHAGYDAVIQRLRDGRQMCKDVEELLKMRALAEEKYGKELVAIARKAGGLSEISTLRASFEMLKSQLQNIGHSHLQLSDTLKEEVKKIENFRERQREQRRKFESIMEKTQKKKISSFKRSMESKRNYELRCKEADDVEQGVEKAAASSKVAEKYRHRISHCKQALLEGEKLYFKSIVHLETVRQEWEETHRSACEVFQQMEGDRISMLRCALWDHCNHFSMQCVKDDESYEEVRKVLEQCDITTDINCFILKKSTGSRPPEPISFESYNRTVKLRESNGQAHLERQNWTRRSSTLMGSSLTVESPQTSHSRLTSAGDIETSDTGYSHLPCHQQETLSTPSAEEDLYVVCYQYNAQEADELTVSKGDMARVLERGDDGWWTVESNGLTGVVPGNYLTKA
ncbi:proline-serine-threonine phosphatase-interacting protein 1-like isoform X2 [Gouania willdenowi]|uniref:Proline-serine-threonine phosphatase-interacting protein 1-like n=1 Tax=Gouania willdenowi TaxID=441366 RepID=A0A8C5D0R5_GOUWI|nr:proline-serine-threonine phosphatase-interacting protein 1-like isoform X2 [Gouania willdenowi]